MSDYIPDGLVLSVVFLHALIQNSDTYLYDLRPNGSAATATPGRARYPVAHASNSGFSDNIVFANKDATFDYKVNNASASLNLYAAQCVFEV